jgi:hypothetical protein
LGAVWREAHLSREGLIARAEIVLGRGCFGKAAAATFARDMRALKAALASAGHELRYSRRPGSEGYAIAGRPPLDDELAAQISAAMAEVDPRQVEITRRLSPAARVRQAGLLSDGLRQMAARRLRQQQPGRPLASVYREVMQTYDRLGG